MLSDSAGKEISEEEGKLRLSAFFYLAANGCVDVVVRVFPVTSTLLNVVVSGSDVQTVCGWFLFRCY
jgi:hypothetical protein